MKNLEYSILINASPKEVWEKMIDAENYKKWVNVSWPGSFYVGEWKKNSEVRFVSKDGSGTLAKVNQLDPYRSIVASHIAVLLPGGIKDTTSDIAKGWIGTTETYTFTDANEQTLLKVVLTINPEWDQMFNDGWPKALKALKSLCEANEPVLA